MPKATRRILSIRFGTAMVSVFLSEFLLLPLLTQWLANSMEVWVLFEEITAVPLTHSSVQVLPAISPQGGAL